MAHPHYQYQNYAPQQEQGQQNARFSWQTPSDDLYTRQGERVLPQLQLQTQNHGNRASTDTEGTRFSWMETPADTQPEVKRPSAQRKPTEPTIQGSPASPSAPAFPQQYQQHPQQQLYGGVSNTYTGYPSTTAAYVATSPVPTAPHPYVASPVSAAPPHQHYPDGPIRSSYVPLSPSSPTGGAMPFHTLPQSPTDKKPPVQHEAHANAPRPDEYKSPIPPDVNPPRPTPMKNHTSPNLNRISTAPFSPDSFIPPTFQQPPRATTFAPDSSLGPNGLDPTLHQPGQVAHPNMDSTSSHSWSHSLFSCHTSCLTGLFAPCILYGRTSYRLSQKSQHKDATDMLGFSNVNTSCALMSAACGFWCLFPMVQRIRVRHGYKIEGSAGSDVVKGLCCCCCVAVQNEREVTEREEKSRRWAGPSAGAGGGYTSEMGMVYAPPPGR